MTVFDLLLITDPDARGGVVETTRRALARAPAGRVAVQLRAKDRSASERVELAHALREVTHEGAALFLVNGDPALARDVDADGVHLPAGSTTPAEARAIANGAKLVGVSCHDLQGVVRAGTGGASYVTLSPFASSPGKGPAVGPERFAEIARATDVPVLALGGVDRSNAAAARAAGAHGIAVIRAVYAAPDPALAVEQLLASLDSARASER